MTDLTRGNRHHGARAAAVRAGRRSRSTDPEDAYCGACAKRGGHRHSMNLTVELVQPERATP